MNSLDWDIKLKITKEEELKHVLQREVYFGKGKC
jgi:hypothetical protein